MVEVVVLGVAGVLQPVAAVWGAEIAAAGRYLARNGLPVADFEPRAWSRVRSGEPAPVARTVRDQVPHWTPAQVRELLQTIRHAVPPVDVEPALDGLRAIRSGHRIAFLDHGAGRRMEPWIERLGAASLAERKLWTDDLGAQARPPRPLAFRWLAERLDLQPDACLYVPGTPLLGRAAQRAGWRVWGGPPSDPAACVDLEPLVAALADGELAPSPGDGVPAPATPSPSDARRREFER